MDPRFGWGRGVPSSDQFLWLLRSRDASVKTIAAGDQSGGADRCESHFPVSGFAVGERGDEGLDCERQERSDVEQTARRVLSERAEVVAGVGSTGSMARQ